MRGIKICVFKDAFCSLLPPLLILKDMIKRACPITFNGVYMPFNPYEVMPVSQMKHPLKWCQRVQEEFSIAFAIYWRSTSAHIHPLNEKINQPVNESDYSTYHG